MLNVAQNGLVLQVSGCAGADGCVATQREEGAVMTDDAGEWGQEAPPPFQALGSFLLLLSSFPFLFPCCRDLQVWFQK